MNINLELPDFVDKEAKEIYINILKYDEIPELVALRRETGKWYVKTARCNMCGACCKGMKLSTGFPFKSLTADQNCSYLNGNLCTFGIHRPFSCVMDFHDDPKLKPPECSEEFKEV